MTRAFESESCQPTGSRPKKDSGSKGMKRARVRPRI